MEKLKNISLKSTIIIYMGIALVCSTVLSFEIKRIAQDKQEKIWLKYVDYDDYSRSIENENGHNYITKVPRIASNLMEEKDVHVVEMCDFVESWGDLLISFFCCSIAVFLFYRKKMKKPLFYLSLASKHISENDLSFIIDYSSDDEMGKLCKDFDKMRRELEKNKKKIWNMIEDERTLRSSIAHDIRTPISLIKGNLEIIDEFLPEKKIDEKKTAKLVNTTIQHVKHLEHFVDMMKCLNSIVDVEPKIEAIKYSVLKTKIYDVQKALCIKKNIEYEYIYSDEDEVINVDPVFILEVEENLLNNAIRYAKSKVRVSFILQDKQVNLIVEDDGDGYQNNPKHLMKAYHKTKENDGETHYGLGLYISRSLCDAHRGKLELENMEDGGARAFATFEKMNDYV